MVVGYCTRSLGIADGYRKFVITQSKPEQAVVVVFGGYDNPPKDHIDAAPVLQLNVLKCLFSLTNPSSFIREVSQQCVSKPIYYTYSSLPSCQVSV